MLYLCRCGMGMFSNADDDSTSGNPTAQTQRQKPDADAAGADAREAVSARTQGGLAVHLRYPTAAEDVLSRSAGGEQDSWNHWWQKAKPLLALRRLDNLQLYGFT